MIGFEHVTNSVVGVPVEPYTLRVTHIFRRENGEWKIAHRHAEYVPDRPDLASQASTTKRDSREPMCRSRPPASW